MPSGVFVRIEDREDGSEGLVHTDELDQSPQDVIEVGDAETTLAQCEQVFGDTHPNTLISQKNLANARKYIEVTPRKDTSI